ncbi:hypothetical protein [Flexibacterium corallicola]|uniref:hypothetical protein n=1 Tax=Flexibacterium corallicola TaxID=3037259 RepID=UPI00286EFA6D|nr:hypothetical protein [Pseudovibrio sp. M1P-2-3]
MEDKYEDHGLSVNDAEEVASKVVEAADRLKVIHSACPGAVAEWGFELDGTSFNIRLSIPQEQQSQ